eukprot:gene12770-17015_t
MDKRAKFDLMEKVSRELEDLKHSQEAVIKKITQIEAHNINLGDSDLDNVLSDIHEQAAENLTRVEDASLSFQQKTEAYATANTSVVRLMLFSIEFGTKTPAHFSMDGSYMLLWVLTYSAITSNSTSVWLPLPKSIA